MDSFFDAVTREAHDRLCDDTPDLQTYLALRRDTSACRPSFALVEYAAEIDLPCSIAEHPCVRTMEDAANDVVSLSNEIYSFNVEQARGDTHNAVIIVMREQGLDMQGALNHVGDLCIAAIGTFARSAAMEQYAGGRRPACLRLGTAELDDFTPPLELPDATVLWDGRHGGEEEADGGTVTPDGADRSAYQARNASTGACCVDGLFYR